MEKASVAPYSGMSWVELKSAIGEAFMGARVNVDDVKQLMSSYVSNRCDWVPYEHFDKHRYTRNLVEENVEKYSLIVLCWESGQGSCIHDHADSHCFMKVLHGDIRETLYECPSHKQKSDKENAPLLEEEVGGAPMQIRKTMVYGVNDVTYINDSIGLHRIENNTHTDSAVTLHLYSPPIRVCNCFEERTGASHKSKVTFYSGGTCN